MGHRKAELEKRIFVLFFIVTFFIVVILISIEWQLAKYGITQYEDVNIKHTLSNFTISLNEKNTTMQHLLHTLSSDPNMIKAIQSKNISNIQKYLTQFHDTQLINNLILYDKSRNLLVGEEWELIQEHFPDIFQYSSKEISSSFIANYGSKLYNINFCPVYSGSTTKFLHGIFIIPQKIEIEQFNIDSEYILTFVSYKDALNETQVPGILKSHIPQMDDIIEEIGNTKQLESINKLNLELATGIRVMYDLKNNPSGIFLVTYIRDINRFAQQSLLLFILILLAVTLIMISTLGNWFSKTILIPVKKISNKMHDIAANPSIIEPIEEKYTGVLGDMVDTFNNMNIALKNYSRSLNEYKLITDNIGSGIFWLDNDFSVIVFNPRFLEILECTSEKEVINKNLSELLGLKEQLIEQVRDNNISLHQLEINIKNKKKFVILNIRAVKYQESFRFFGSITNITKEVKAIKAQESMELELIKSNKLAGYSS
ncbi:MAG: PAS domain-containing protein [Candidatus Cloacimonetes bacterium]|nr:PAS domain-containing protein [Candidatus Cloacimonadota bacterium]